MLHEVDVEISMDLYKQLKKAAKSRGISAEELASHILEDVVRTRRTFKETSNVRS